MFFLLVYIVGNASVARNAFASTAKEKLSTNSLSVSEIAYALGFKHPQSVSTLFKRKTNLSPLEFRQAFN